MSRLFLNDEFFAAHSFIVPDIKEVNARIELAEVKIEFIGIVNFLEYRVTENIAYHYGPFLDVLFTHKNAHRTFGGVRIETEVHCFIVVIDTTEGSDVSHAIHTNIVGICTGGPTVLYVIAESKTAALAIRSKT